jgi:hypothetical protein
MTELESKLESNWKSILLIYAFAIFVIVISTVLAPTNLAGPGLDMLFILITVTSNVVFLFRSIFRLAKQGKTYRASVIVHGAIFFLWFGSIIITVIYAAITSA